MKDFYDLWVLAQRFEFDNATLAAALQATFKARRTTLKPFFAWCNMITKMSPRVACDGGT